MSDLSEKARLLVKDAERISDLLVEPGTPLWDTAHLIAVILWKYGELQQEVVKRMEEK